MRELDALSAALRTRTQPVTVFFRDDDAGWANEQLISLCETVHESGIQLDLAVIPAALDADLVKSLIRLDRQFGATINFHQHGYAHTNHQQQGRKCEFGDQRSTDLQRHDIALGQKNLQQNLGSLLDPIFTPPWNRCTGETCAVLVELGFSALSRISGSLDIDHAGLQDISVSVDWEKKRRGTTLSWLEFCRYAEHYLLTLDVVGIMLHHQNLADLERQRLRRFIDCLRDSGKVHFKSMLQIIDADRLERGGSNHAIQ